MINRPRAVHTDTGDLDQAAGIALLEVKGFEVRIPQTHNPEPIAEAAAEATVLLVGYAPIDAALLARLPNFAIISMLSHGYNSVDVSAAQYRGIQAATVADIAAEDVAIQARALALALAVIRRLQFFADFDTERGWLDRPHTPPPQLSELTDGILCLGSTGKRFAALAAPHVRGVIGHDPAPAATPPVARLTNFWSVVEEADLLSLNLPLTPRNIGLIDGPDLARMPRNSYLINVSRGGLIDAQAAVEAVPRGQLAGVGLDVHAPESPAADDPLLRYLAVWSTPHVTYLSTVTESGYGLAQARNVIDWARTGMATNPLGDVRDAIQC